MTPGNEMAGTKRVVYILKSILEPDEYYVGLTSDPEARLTAHTEGMSPHTAGSPVADSRPHLIRGIHSAISIA